MHKIYESKSEIFDKYYYVVIFTLPISILLYLSDEKFWSAFFFFLLFLVTLRVLQRIALPALVISETHIEFFRYGMLLRKKKIKYEDIELIEITQPYENLSAIHAMQDNIFRFKVFLHNGKKITFRANCKDETQITMRKKLQDKIGTNVHIEWIIKS